MKNILINTAILLAQIATILDAAQTPFKCENLRKEVGSSEDTLTLPGDGFTFPSTCNIVFDATFNSVDMTFSEFKFGDNCDENYIIVGNGDGKTNDEYKTFCGNVLPVVPISIGNGMFINITAKSLPPGSSLVVKYKRAETPATFKCNATPTPVELNQLTTWPPRNTLVESRCTFDYKITATTPEKSIQISFTYFEFPDESNCTIRYVQIGNGAKPETGDQKYCGSKIPQIPVSSGDKMYIRIQTDYLPWGNLIQFEAVEVYSTSIYENITTNSQIVDTTVSEFECNPETHEASNTTQNLVIPSNGFQLPATFSCTYQIKASKGSVLELDFTHFKVGSSTTCETEYVVISENEKPTENEGKKLCGPQKPEIPVSKVSHVHVHMEGRKFSADDGFTLSYKSAKNHGARVFTPSAMLMWLSYFVFHG